MANELQKPSGRINIFNYRQHIAYMEQAEGRIAEKEEELNIQAQAQAKKEEELNAQAQAQAKKEEELKALEQELANLRISLEQYQESLDERDAHYSDREFDLSQREEKIKGYANPIEYAKKLVSREEEIMKAEVEQKRVAAQQERVEAEQKRVAAHQKRVANEQQNTAQQQDARREALDFRQKALSESERVLKRQPVGLKAETEKDKINNAMQAKLFEDIISDSIEDFKPIMAQLGEAERLTGFSASSEKKFELYKFKARMLGLLAAYVDMDQTRTSTPILKDFYYTAIEEEMKSMLQNEVEVDGVENPNEEIQVAFGIGLLTAERPDIYDSLNDFIDSKDDCSKENVDFLLRTVSKKMLENSNTYVPQDLFKNFDFKDNSFKNQNRGSRGIYIKRDSLNSFIKDVHESKNLNSSVAYGIYKAKTEELEDQLDAKDER